MENILFIVNSLRFGGAEKHVVHLLNKLDHSLFNLNLVYLKNDEHLLSQLHQERLSSIKCCNRKKRLDLACLFSIRKLVLEKQITTIVCINEFPMAYAKLAILGIKNTPRLVEVFHTTELLGSYSDLKMLFYRFLFKSFDQVVFVSRNQRNYWVNEMGLSLRNEMVIHNGIDTKVFRSTIEHDELLSIRKQYSINSDDYLLCMVAAFRPEKRHVDVVKAISRLNQRGQSVNLLVIGDGDEKQNIKNTIKAHSLENQIFLMGFQDNVRPFLEISDCVVMASTAVETFSIAILEAMAMSKPVISSDIGGASEQIEHKRTGFLFNKGDVNGLQEGIVFFMDEERRINAGHAAREKVVAEFQDSKMLNDFNELLIF